MKKFSLSDDLLRLPEDQWPADLWAQIHFDEAVRDIEDWSRSSVLVMTRELDGMLLFLSVLQVKKLELEGGRERTQHFKESLPASEKKRPTTRKGFLQKEAPDLPVIELPLDESQMVVRADSFAQDFAEWFIRSKVVVRDLVQDMLEWLPDRRAVVMRLIRRATSVVLDRAEGDISRAGRFTHPSLAPLIAEIFQLEGECSIHDPACGGGGTFLPLLVDGDLQARVDGTDVNGFRARIAQFLLDVNDFPGRIREADLFVEPPFLDRGGVQKYDLVLVDPPIGLHLDPGQQMAVSKNVGHRFDWGESPENLSGEMLFLCHALASCRKDGGRVAALLPPRTLFRGGEDGKVRGLLTRNSPIPLRAVIQLPGKLFGTNMELSLVLFDSQERSENVVFVDGSKDFKGARPVPSQFLDPRCLGDAAPQNMVASFWNQDKGRKNTKDLAQLVRQAEPVPGKVAVVGVHEMEAQRFSWEVRKYLPPVQEVESKFQKEERLWRSGDLIEELMKMDEAVLRAAKQIHACLPEKT